MISSLPESLLQLIGDFVISFPKDKSKLEQNQAKKKFARTLACSYPEYSELLIHSNSIPDFTDLKQIYNKEKDDLLKEAESKIKKYKLESFRDVIMENFMLSIPNLIIISEQIYRDTKDIDRTCEIFCKLGYPGYENRYGNEDYLINLIHQWVEFSKRKGYNLKISQLNLLYYFISIDSEEGYNFCLYNMTEHKGLWSFFPYSVDNVDSLIDFVIRHDTFYTPSDYCTDINVLEKDMEGNFNLFPIKITPSYICQYIIENDNFENVKKNPTSIIRDLANALKISKYSSKEDIDNAIRNIANLLEYVSSTSYDCNDLYDDIDNIFCVKLVPTELSNVYVVRLEDNIQNVLNYLYFNHINHDKSPQKLKLNGFVYWHTSRESEKLKLEDAEKFYRYGDEGKEDIPYMSILCNYYTYLFNKANDEVPLSLFAVCVYTKWLVMNENVICDFLPEVSTTELNSLLLDYAIDTYGSLCPIPENYILSFKSTLQIEEEELIDIIYDLKERRPITNYELVDFWKYIVLDRQIGLSKGKTYEELDNLKVAAQEYPENGTLMLPWKYVRYTNGKAFFYHPNHEKGYEARLPYIFESDSVKKSFSELSKKILWNFPAIECSAYNGKIIIIDERYAEYVISTITYIYQVFERRQKVINVSNGLTAKDILYKFKSVQLSYLENKQLKLVPIIPIGEKVYTSLSYREEPALLFTIGKSLKTLTLIYENTSISRASYIFIIKRDKLESVINKIKEYFTSKIPNKRSVLQYSRDMFLQSDGFLRVIRVIHDDLDNWKSTVNFYAKTQSN